MDIKIGAYDADGHLVGTASAGPDGTLSEPLQVPAGGMLLVGIPWRPEGELVPMRKTSTVDKVAVSYPSERQASG